MVTRSFRCNIAFGLCFVLGVVVENVGVSAAWLWRSMYV